MNSRSMMLTATAGLVLTVGLGGCAFLPKVAHWARVTPVHAADDAKAGTVDGYYADAAAAIERRDYARALEALQLARGQAPDDVRVLNAFGVVYDKLGRFDLSARYYRMAAALQPDSPVIEANRTYSAELRQRAQAPVLLAAASPPKASPASPAEVAPARAAPAQTAAPGVIRLAYASPQQAVRRLPLLTGHPLRIADATGRAGAGEPVRAELARLGWSAQKAALTKASPAEASTITFASQDQGTAQALARTLPSKVAMVECAAPCAGVRLTLGRDALSWRAAPWSPAAAKGGSS
ncbi:LytR C-terminal domain-containing protein [Phenylobacterium sp.]|uniref:LytR C-terminal domain-containing protein n=1 Tax=Phenylobacterium sp. TaxID=1871053 RepID=UPI0035B3DF57